MKQFLTKIRGHFFTGVLAFLPLGVTAYVIYLLMSHGNAFIVSITPQKYYAYVTHQHFWWLWRIIVLVAIVIFFAILGILTKIYLGKRFLEISDSCLTNIPLVNKVYSIIKQISSAVFGQKSSFFKKVVLVEHPCKGVWALAFFTSYAKGELARDEPMLNLFLPTTPNPTSGFFLMVLEKDVTFLKMSSEDAIKLIISGGAIGPEET